MQIDKRSRTGAGKHKEIYAETNKTQVETLINSMGLRRALSNRGTRSPAVLICMCQLLILPFIGAQECPLLLHISGDGKCQYQYQFTTCELPSNGRRSCIYKWQTQDCS